MGDFLRGEKASTEAATATPDDAHDDSEGKSTLVKKSSVRKDESQDMYAHVDKEVVDEFDEQDDPVLDVPVEELRGDPWKRFRASPERLASEDPFLEDCCSPRTLQSF